MVGADVLKRVHWLSPIAAHERALLQSSAASIRLRAGALCAVNPPFRWTWGEEFRCSPHVLVVGKIFSNDIERRSSEWMGMISRIRNSGGLVVLDYTDHHLGFKSPMTQFYRDAVRLSHHVVVPSNAMAECLGPISSIPITVIPDAIEVPIVSPIPKAHGNTRRVLWFGHGTNLSFLAEWIASLNPSHISSEIELNILTGKNQIEGLTRDRLSSRIPMRVRASVWSVETMIQASREADLCVIPSDPSDIKKRGASTNRLMTALSLGLPVAADPVQSYLDFKQYWVELRSDQFYELLRTPSVGHRAVLEAQREALPNFSKTSIGSMWSQFLSSLC